jgi:hypothetical protein
MRAVLLLLALAGCAGQPTERVVLRPCSPMPVRPYTADQQRAMADELESRPNHPLLAPMDELHQWRIAGRVLTLCWQEEGANAR